MEYTYEFRDAEERDLYCSRARGFPTIELFRAYYAASPDGQREIRDSMGNRNDENDEDRKRSLEMLRINQ